MFRRLYVWMLGAARHRHADWYLGGISVAESSFFPIPPDVMLAPMTLARPQEWRYLAALTTITSVIGGMLGYLIGLFLLDAVLPLVDEWGYRSAYDTAVRWFDEYGFWAIFLAGFTPIPYKVFTIAAGAVNMAFIPFVLGSAIGRGGRFFLVAGLVRWLGPRFEQRLIRHLDWIGWGTVAVVVGGVLLYKS